MIDLPKSTDFNKRIPKQKFYEKIGISTALKRIFVEQIQNVFWRNKIAETTTNLLPGEKVAEIEIFEINLKEEINPEKVLVQIDKAIPYHIVFLLEYAGEYQLWTAYKEIDNSVQNGVKVGTYYHTDWLEDAEILLKIDGFNMDKVYENFVRQIAGDLLHSEKQESLKESVDRDHERQKLQKKIDALQQKIRREKQFNKQVELNNELKKLIKELEKIV